MIELLLIKVSGNLTAWNILREQLISQSWDLHKYCNLVSLQIFTFSYDLNYIYNGLDLKQKKIMMKMKNYDKKL